MAEFNIGLGNTEHLRTDFLIIRKWHDTCIIPFSISENISGTGESKLGRPKREETIFMFSNFRRNEKWKSSYREFTLCSLDFFAQGEQSPLFSAFTQIVAPLFRPWQVHCKWSLFDFSLSDVQENVRRCTFSLKLFCFALVVRTTAKAFCCPDE